MTEPQEVLKPVVVSEYFSKPRKLFKLFVILLPTTVAGLAALSKILAALRGTATQVAEGLIDQLNHYTPQSLFYYYETALCGQPVCIDGQHTLGQYFEALRVALVSFFSLSILNLAMLVGIFLLLYSDSKKHDRLVWLFAFPFVFPIYATILKNIVIFVVTTFGGFLGVVTYTLGVIVPFLSGMVLVVQPLHEVVEGARAAKEIGDEVQELTRKL